MHLITQKNITRQSSVSSIFFSIFKNENDCYQTVVPCHTNHSYVENMLMRLVPYLEKEDY